MDDENLQKFTIYKNKKFIKNVKNIKNKKIYKKYKINNK